MIYALMLANHLYHCHIINALEEHTKSEILSSKPDFLIFNKIFFRKNNILL